MESNLSKPPTLEEVLAYEIDVSGSPQTFSQRLAKENRWALTFAVRVTDEYKKFMFLAATCGHPVAPSSILDQAWHLHLLYTRSYWEDFCGSVLRRKIHHVPSSERQGEAEQFAKWYADTLASYRKLIGTEPPADIWPSPGDNSRKADLRWVDLRRNWIIRKPWSLK